MINTSSDLYSAFLREYTRMLVNYPYHAMYPEIQRSDRKCESILICFSSNVLNAVDTVTEDMRGDILRVT